MRRTVVVVSALALLLVGFDHAYLRPIRVHRQWYSRVEADLRSLQHRRPADVGREEWAYVVGWTLNALGNCGSARGFVDPGLTEGFAAELEQKLRGRVGLDTIDWIWDELIRLT